MVYTIGYQTVINGEHPKCVNLFFCSDGSLARFLDIREQDFGVSATSTLRQAQGRQAQYKSVERCSHYKFYFGKIVMLPINEVLLERIS